MLKEFAVEPAVLGDWHEYRCLYDKFGAPRARMIAEFPKKWLRMVYDATAHFTDSQRKEIELWLTEAKKYFLIPNNYPYRSYDIPTDWLKSAEAAHMQKQFHAIIATDNPRNHPQIIISGGLYERDSRFQCQYECFMPKNSTGFREISQNLLQWSTKIIFVDPYFTTFDKWMDPLKVMLCCIPQKIEKLCYCTRLEPKDTLVARRQELESRLSSVIPLGQTLEVVILEKNDSMDTHNRFLLTELGGIKFPWGFDEATDSPKDTVNLMDFKTHQGKFDEYSAPELFGHSVALRFIVPGNAKQ